MAKKLPNGQLQVEKGDTLYSIYGPNWASASGYKGDPKTLKIGTVLPAPGVAPKTPAPASPSAPATPSVATPTSPGTPAPAPADQSMNVVPAVPAGGAAAQPTGLDAYLASAKANLDPNFQSILKQYQDAQAVTQQSFSDLAKTTLDREPIVRQIYANLANELDVSQQIETTQAQQTGEQRVGEAKAALAGAGIENAQGSFRAPVTAAENARDATFASIADKYNVKKEDVAAQLTSSVADLYDKAAGYTAQGNQALADMTTKIADLQYNYQGQVADLAKQMYQTDSDERKFELQQKMDTLKWETEQAKLDVMNKNADIAQQRADISEQNAQTASKRADIAQENANTTAARASVSEANATAASNRANALASATLTKDAQAQLLPTSISHVSDAFLANPTVDIGGGKTGSLLGDDGKANPVAFQKLLKQWQSQGLTATDFYKNFSQYINPKYPEQYGLSKAQLAKLVAS